MQIPERVIERRKILEGSVEKKMLDDLARVDIDIEPSSNPKTKELRTIVRQAFNKFVFDKDFQNIYISQKNAEGKSRILENLGKLKEIYYKNILSDISFTTFINRHMRDLVAILDFGLGAQNIDERIKELGANLSLSGRTFISDELRYPEITKQNKDKEELMKRINEAAEKRWKQHFSGRSKPAQIRMNTNSSVSNPFYQNVYDSIKATPNLELCVKSPKSSKYIPEITTAVKGYQVQGINEKLSTIFSENKSVSCTYFMMDVDKTTSAKNAVLQRIIDNYASRTGKKSVKFEITDMNTKTWNWLSSYYEIDQHVSNFVLKMKENYSKSLVDMINRTYNELIRTPGIRN